jgi:hypothetical protein
MTERLFCRKGLYRSSVIGESGATALSGVRGRRTPSSVESCARALSVMFSKAAHALSVVFFESCARTFEWVFEGCVRAPSNVRMDCRLPKVGARSPKGEGHAAT